MKETFDAESKKALIEYRIAGAYETLKEADYNAKGGFYHAASIECSMRAFMLS